MLHTALTPTPQRLPDLTSDWFDQKAARVLSELEAGRATWQSWHVRAEALRQLAPGILGAAVDVPAPGEYVADGAARQAAWVLTGADTPPEWAEPGTEHYALDPSAQTSGQAVRARYAAARQHLLNRP